tara:strand:- start:868 stop:1248 length:381 start_codon:yes stop_codon:yes gene_type:complete
MAYSGNAVVTHLGGIDYLVTITETEAAAGSIATISGLPKKGRVLAQMADKTAGAAATIDPKLTTVSGSSAATETVVENGTAAASVSNQADPPIQYYSATGELFHQSVVASASDNSVTTVYIIKAGW